MALFPNYVFSSFDEAAAGRNLSERQEHTN